MLHHADEVACEGVAKEIRRLVGIDLGVGLDPQPPVKLLVESVHVCACVYMTVHVYMCVRVHMCVKLLVESVHVCACVYMTAMCTCSW